MNEIPICKITKLEFPSEMPIDGDLQITVEYDNTSVEGPTFYRMRKPGTWDFTMMSDTPVHTPGTLHGGHIYHMVPAGHLILQVEVGYGTWLNPTKITDTKMIIILHPDYPAPDPEDTQIIVDIVTPPVMWAVTQRFWAEPGSVIVTAWIYDNRDGEFPWTVKYSPSAGNIDPVVVTMKWTVNGLPFETGLYEVGAGEVHIIEMTAEIPDGFKGKWVSFTLIPINPDLVVTV